MISRTKYQLDEATILQLFAKAGNPNVTHAEPLGDGEFNVSISRTQISRTMYLSSLRGTARRLCAMSKT